MPGSGISLTGKLGDVIKESATIALAFLRAHAFELGLTQSPDTDLLDKRAIHLHMPEGAIGKEGPSAGTAILTAFVSLFSKTGVSSELGASLSLPLLLSLHTFSTPVPFVEVEGSLSGSGFAHARQPSMS